MVLYACRKDELKTDPDNLLIGVWNYAGTWTIVNDTLLQINDGYWGGTTSYKLDIESVTRDSLKINMVYENKK
jgi:hypothetical protein